MRSAFYTVLAYCNLHARKFVSTHCAHSAISQHCDYSSNLSLGCRPLDWPIAIHIYSTCMVYVDGKVCWYHVKPQNCTGQLKSALRFAIVVVVVPLDLTPHPVPLSRAIIIVCVCVCVDIPVALRYWRSTRQIYHAVQSNTFRKWPKTIYSLSLALTLSNCFYLSHFCSVIMVYGLSIISIEYVFWSLVAQQLQTNFQKSGFHLPYNIHIQFVWTIQPALKYFINGFVVVQPLKPITNSYHYLDANVLHIYYTYPYDLQECPILMLFIYLSFDQSLAICSECCVYQTDAKHSIQKLFIWIYLHH